jgi:spermidine synthase
VLLGMVSPYALRLKARSVEHIGTDAGDLFAVSTVASVISALATGFWLIPQLGVARLVVLLGVLLLIAGALAFFSARRSTRRGAAAAGLCLVLAGAAAISGSGAGKELPRGLLYLHDSPYAEIRVLDREEGRFLVLDGAVHTIAGFGVGESWHRYVPVFESCPRLFDAPGRVLLLGLGGGVVAQAYHAAGWEVDAVEIDPAVVQVAREYFGLEQSQARIHPADARRFLATHDETWDLILVDAFGSASIPFHLVTREFFALLRERLSPGGVVAMNVECRGWYDPIIGSIGRSLMTSFPVVWALPTAEPPNTLGNVVLVASGDPGFRLLDEELPHPQDFLHDDYEHWRAVQVMHAWDNAYLPSEHAGRILSDNSNPVALWSDAVNREARADLRDYFGDDPTLH